MCPVYTVLLKLECALNSFHIKRWLAERSCFREAEIKLPLKLGLPDRIVFHWSLFNFRSVMKKVRAVLHSRFQLRRASFPLIIVADSQICKNVAVIIFWQACFWFWGQCSQAANAMQSQCEASKEAKPCTLPQWISSLCTLSTPPPCTLPHTATLDILSVHIKPVHILSLHTEHITSVHIAAHCPNERAAQAVAKNYKFSRRQVLPRRLLVPINI